MRFMFIVKSTHPAAPSPKLLEAMHKLADREIKAGRMNEHHAGKGTVASRFGHVSSDRRSLVAFERHVLAGHASVE